MIEIKNVLFNQLFIVFPFLGHPVWLKHTLNMVIYVYGSKGSQKAPAQKQNCYRRSTILIEVKYQHFYPIIHCILHLVGHPVWWKYTLNRSIYVFWTKGTQKVPAQKEYFYGRATILIGVKYLHFRPFFIVFYIFWTPCVVKNEFKQYICIVWTQGCQELPFYLGLTFQISHRS